MPLPAAFDLAGTYTLIATTVGVSAWIFNGQAVQLTDAAPGVHHPTQCDKLAVGDRSG